MIIKKDYQVGYINGYLEALLSFYNLRYMQKNDFRLTHGFFIKTVATGDLTDDIITALTEFHHRLSPAKVMDQQQIKEGLQLNRLNVNFRGLAHYLEPWLPHEEQKEIAKYRQSDDFSPAFDNLVETVLEYVIRDYGLSGENYSFWQVDTRDITKLFFRSIDQVQTIVFENSGNVCVLHFVREFLYN